MSHVRRNWQLIAFLGLAFLAIVLVSNDRSQGDRITRIERPDCRSERDREYCERVFREVVNNASPEQLRSLATRLVVVSRPQSGQDGRAGTTGKTGATGKPGATGKSGTPGATGLQGPAGPRGATGARGPQGERGAKGEKGDPGAPGADARVDANAVINEVLARLCRINPLLC